MSMWLAGATVVSAGISAYSSNKASKEAASGQKKGMQQSLALTNQARQDVMKLFERSATNNGMSMKAALDYYKTAAPKRYTPYMQGNQQAQTVIGQGAAQANNAILGLPVDMSFTQQPQIVPGTDHLIGAEIPQFETGILVQNQDGTTSLAQNQGKPSSKDMLLTGGGITSDPTKKGFYDPEERLTNPLGLSKSLNDKVSPKKLLKKIF